MNNKRKHKAIIFSLLFALTIISTSQIRAACKVDPNPAENIGHCRVEPDGTEICFITGSGIPCSDTILI